MEERLRDALLYLSGVTLRVSPKEYPHTDGDFAAYRAEAGL